MSEQTATTDTGATSTTTPTETVESGKDWQAEADKWKTLARKHESTAKANADAAKRLADIEESQKTDLEKAITAALQQGVEKGRAETTAQFTQQLAAARIEAALTGVVNDPRSIVEDLNLSKFVTDDGQVDEAAITALREKYDGVNPKRADVGQGARGAMPLAGDPLEQSVKDIFGIR